MTTPGKYRHLAQSSTPEGQFVVLAIDHRDNLLSKLNEFASQPLSDAEFTTFKLQVMSHLSPLSSAVLADPAYGVGPGIAQGAIGGQAGLLAPLEITDYTPHPSRRETRFIDGWSVAKIKLVGGTGVKLLLYYHPDAANAQLQRDIVANIVDQCDHYDIPFFLEPIAYSLDVNQPLDSQSLRRVVVESARTFAGMGVDVLKVEFPLDVKQQPDEFIWREALTELDDACEDTPWALLSAGVDFDTFLRQARLACEAGASGVIVGRAVWAEAVELQGHDRELFLAHTARTRMQQLAEVCKAGTSWWERTPAPDVPLNWYETYGE